VLGLCGMVSSIRGFETLAINHSRHSTLFKYAPSPQQVIYTDQVLGLRQGLGMRVQDCNVWAK